MTIRRTPEDFVVQERLAPDLVASWTPRPSPATAIAVYSLRKNSLTTPEAVHWLARSLGVRDGLVCAAGLKDKHAVTTQHVTVRQPDSARRASLPAGVSGDNGHGWSASLLGWTHIDLAADAIVSNHFAIVVRDLTRAAASEMDRRAALLSEPASTPSVSSTAPDRLLLTNYFGDQRFGSARHGEGWIAEHLIRADFEHALRLAIATPARKDTGNRRTFSRLAAAHWGDWARLAAELPRCPERRSIEALAAGQSFRDAFASLPAFTQQMCVEAYQSHLWNEIVRRFVRSLATRSSAVASTAAPVLVSTPDPFGEMVFAGASCLTAELMALRWAMPSPSASFAESEAPIAAGVLAELGLSLAGLSIPGLRRPAFGDALRPVFVAASEFSMTRPEPDDLARSSTRLKRTLRFSLPRGSYATVLLRALGC